MVAEQVVSSSLRIVAFMTFLNMTIADRVIQIQEDLVLHFCNLQVPPDARTNSQMTKKEAQKIKEIANLRIHLERPINRIKNYRILKGTLPISSMQHVDEIVIVCAVLCNMKNVLFQTKKINSQ